MYETRFIARGNFFMSNIRDIAKEAGVSVTTVSRVVNNHPYVTEEKQLAQKILKQMNLPDALIVTNDAHCTGLYAEFQNQGIKVPEDIALISYENGELSQVNNITSIDLPLLQMGERSVELILSDSATSEELPSKLIIRKST